MQRPRVACRSKVSRSSSVQELHQPGCCRLHWRVFAAQSNAGPTRVSHSLPPCSTQRATPFRRRYLTVLWSNISHNMVLANAGQPESMSIAGAGLAFISSGGLIMHCVVEGNVIQWSPAVLDSSGAGLYAFMTAHTQAAGCSTHRAAAPPSSDLTCSAVRIVCV
jgi:hypothetical protein